MFTFMAVLTKASTAMNVGTTKSFLVSTVEISTALSPLIIEEKNGADVLAIQYAMNYWGKRRNLDPQFPLFIFAKYKNLPLPKEYMAQYPQDYAAHLRAEMKWDKEKRLQWGGG